MGWQWPASGQGVLSAAVHAQDLLKEVTIIFITSTIVWPQVNNRDDTTLMAESEEELKSLLIKVKVESEIVGLKLNIQKTNQSDYMDHSLV